MKTIAADPTFKAYFEDAHHTDEKHIVAEASLREFIAGMLSHYPWWLVMLYRVREILVKMLGLVRHPKPETLPALRPDEIPFSPGSKASFFIVRQAEEDHYWITESPPDNHLGAYLGVVAHPLGGGKTRFCVFTSVRYHHWTGPVYFNLIRPFHHLVVSSMMKAGAAGKMKTGTGPSDGSNGLTTSH